MGPFDGTNYDGCDANFPRFPTESERERVTKSKNQLIRIDLRWETAALIALFALPSSRAHVCVCDGENGYTVSCQSLRWVWERRDAVLGGGLAG